MGVGSGAVGVVASPCSSSSGMLSKRLSSSSTHPHIWLLYHGTQQ